MNPRTAPLLLAVGVVLGSAFSLYAGSPAAALAGWALALLGTTVLVKEETAFSVARNGVIFCVAAEVATLAGFAQEAATWIRLVGILLLLTGAASAYRTTFSTGFRADAAGRINTLAYLAVLPLALARTMVEAKIGPGWVPTAADVFTALTMVTAAWLAAYAAASREALQTA